MQFVASTRPKSALRAIDVFTKVSWAMWKQRHPEDFGCLASPRFQVWNRNRWAAADQKYWHRSALQRAASNEVDPEQAVEQSTADAAAEKVCLSQLSPCSASFTFPLFTLVSFMHTRRQLQRCFIRCIPSFLLCPTLRLLLSSSRIH